METLLKLLHSIAERSSYNDMLDRTSHAIFASQLEQI